MAIFCRQGNLFENGYLAEGRIGSVSDPEGGVWSFYNDFDLTNGNTRVGYTTAEGNLYDTLIDLQSAGEEHKTTTREDGTVVSLVTDLDNGGGNGVRS